MRASWNKTPVRDISTRITKGTTPTTGGGSFAESGIAFIKVESISEAGNILAEKLAYIDEVTNQILSRSIIQKDDVLFTIAGTIGRTALIREEHLPANTNQAVAIVRPDQQKVLPRFLYYALSDRSKTRQAESRTVQSVQANFSLGELGALEVELPSLTEQGEIASILGALDDKIELNRRMSGTLEALAQAVFKEWFVEKAEEGWEETSLAAQVEVAKGLSYKGSGLADAGRPMHNLNSIYEFGRYKYEGIKWYTGEFKERHLCKAGDVIVANTEQGFDHLLIGSAAIVPKRFGDEGLFTHHIYRVRPLPTSYLTNHFLYLLLSHPAVREQVQGYTNGTTVNSLAKEGLERPTFKLPPKALVEKFDAVVAPLFARQEANYEETQTLTALRDTLLPKLMRGEVRVKVKQYT